MYSDIVRQGVIYFNNSNNLDLNLYITDYPTIELNNEEYEEQQIEGHNGAYYNNLGYYKDRKLDFSFDLKGTDIENKMYAVKDWLTNFSDNRLLFNNEKCYLVKKVLLNSFKQINVHVAELEVSFIVDPFLYDYENTTFATTKKSFNLKYNGTQNADTIIKIYGSGDIQISNNGETMQIDDIENYILLDSKAKECVDSNGTSKDWDTIGNYISLGPGDNNFELTGSITKTEIIYRNTYL